MNSAGLFPRQRLLLLLFIGFPLFLPAAGNWILTTKAPGAFPLASGAQVAGIACASGDHPVVGIAARDLAGDLQQVTGLRPEMLNQLAANGPVVVIGTLGRSSLLDDLREHRDLNLDALEGAWESFVITTMAPGQPDESPVLVIAGSDPRGTAYGVYELSRAVGISPWHWWADVPARPAEALWIPPGTRRFGPPSVRYRGIFINDEDWGLHPWASRTFDPDLEDIGPRTYEKVFELLLRLKANTLWPAMHEVTRAFNLYPENAVLADRYAIVMGSSHAEPMLRNNVTEWTYPKEDYNYSSNRDGVLRYWEERLEANGGFENVYTLGMRGIHDSGMTSGETQAERVALLEQIIADQRQLLARHVDPVVETVPQVFTPYKEVLELYEAGLQVPDDVTLVWPDDNHGYIRRFPRERERTRGGGSGVYYHISYLGSPMAYLWLHTTPPALVWEEMGKAYTLGARDYWILNVGDIKPAELGMEFFLQMAWDIEAWTIENQDQFLRAWFTREFGGRQGSAMAAVMEDYFALNYERRPEHLQWWLPHARVRGSDLTVDEIKSRLGRFAALVSAVDKIREELAEEALDAFFQLVEYPVKASAAANRRYFHAEQYGRLFNADPPAARIHGLLARRAEDEIRRLTRSYNEEIADGKWRRFMAPEPADNMWRSYRASPVLLPEPNMVADALPGPAELAVLPLAGPEPEEAAVSREAESFELGGGGDGRSWEILKGLGDGGAVVLPYPFSDDSMPAAEAARSAPWMEYTFDLPVGGKYLFMAKLIPTYPLGNDQVLEIALRLDDGEIRVAGAERRTNSDDWKQEVLSGEVWLGEELEIPVAGPHRLRIYLMDPGVVLDRWQLSLSGQ